MREHALEGAWIWDLGPDNSMSRVRVAAAVMLPAECQLPKMSNSISSSSQTTKTPSFSHIDSHVIHRVNSSTIIFNPRNYY